MSEKWTAADLPDLSGRVMVVTGANGGLGLASTRMLAGAGATVVMACRDQDKARAAVETIERDLPAVRAERRLALAALDLGDLTSVARFADELRATYDRLDVILCNAGVMAIPHRETVDGFEMQLGINHLGHFALVGHLLEPLLATPGARVVSVSSNAHRMGRIEQADPMLEQPGAYGKWKAYGQSKLANLLYAFELQRRFARARAKAIAVAAHPGYAGTDLAFVGPRMEGARLMERLTGVANRLLAQPVEMGALPQVYAAAAPVVEGGAYYGPDGPAEWRGHPKRVEARQLAHDRDLAAWLWQLSVERTGVDYAALDGRPG